MPMIDDLQASARRPDLMSECPGCGSSDVQVVDDQDVVVFRCESCAHRWRYELGWVWPCGSH